MAYQPRYNDELIDELYHTILKLETVEDCQRFFDDLCTISELQSFSQRLNVAKKLYANETYAEIEEETGVSAATISRISKTLSNGAGGYQRILNGLFKDQP